MTAEREPAEVLGACVFCRIVASEAPAEMVTEWDDAIAFRPLGPVTNGHTLVIPKTHVSDYMADPDVTAATMRRAAQLAPMIHRQSNLITSCGEWATQTVFHLHVHIVPRRPSDGLTLPWTALAAAAGTTREAEAWDEGADAAWVAAAEEVAATRVFCPVHQIPDCSPMLNGCSLVIQVSQWRDVLARKIALAATKGATDD